MLCNHDRDLVFAFYKKFGDVDVLMVEALSLLTGLQICKKHMAGNVLMEVDSNVLVQLVSSGLVARWSLVGTLQHIQALLNELHASLDHIFRKANSLANALAFARLERDLDFTSSEHMQIRVKYSTQLDKSLVPRLRRYCTRE